MNMTTAELVTRQSIQFAVGDTSLDRIPFAITGELVRSSKDNTLFITNLKDAKINGEIRKVGDSFRIVDSKTGDEDVILRVKVSINDSRKVFANAPAAASLPTQQVVSNV